MEGIFSDEDYLSSCTNVENEVSNIYIASAAIKGGKNEFITLIESYKSYLYKTAFLYVKNEHDALDIYQETVYKAYLNISKLKKPEFFKTWITRILINNANDKLKLSGKQNLILNEEQIDNNSHHNNSVTLEEKIDLYEAIDSLSEKYKTSIILRYFHNMSIKEISKVIKCPENTVKSYIHRAKAILLKSLKEDI